MKEAVMLSKFYGVNCLPARVTHSMGHLYLRALNFKKPRTLKWNSFQWRGLEFSNPLGTSGGVDKNAQFLKAWWSSGAGFVEVGTCTPQAQKANPGPTLARHSKQQALWNRLGFPNRGAAYVAQQLEKHKPYCTPVFVNIGKNRNTPNPQATKDYLLCMHLLAPVADVFVVNISSPNTQGLRELLKPTEFKNFLQPITQAKNNTSLNKPILLKLSPDVKDNEFKQVLDISLQLGVDGWIIANTSAQLSHALGFVKNEHSLLTGGVSGAPLKKQACHLLKLAVQHLNLTARPKGLHKGPLLVSSGGVFNNNDVHERLQAGAQLVQVYTSLVFYGPQWFAQTLKT